MSWADAESYCQSWIPGAHLASVHSVEESNFIHQTFPAEVSLGGSDIESEENWKWSDGSVWDYDNWAPGQPDNEQHKQHCLLGNWLGGDQWDDATCTYPRLFVCKK